MNVFFLQTCYHLNLIVIHELMLLYNGKFFYVNTFRASPVDQTKYTPQFLKQVASKLKSGGAEAVFQPGVKRPSYDDSQGPELKKPNMEGGFSSEQVCMSNIIIFMEFLF